MKRLLTHRLVNKYSDNSTNWNRMKVENKILLNVPMSLLRYLVNTHGATSISDSVYGETFYIANRGRTIIVPNTVTRIELFDIEGASVASNYFRDDSTIKRGGIGGVRRAYEKYQEVKRYEIVNVKSAKQNYIDTLKTSKEKEVLFLNTLTQLDEFERYNIRNGKFTVTFEDVIAEDTEAVGDDINLGKLVFSVDIHGNDVQLIEGTYPQGNDYNSSAFHPHQLSASICLGTQDSDMHEAISNNEFSIVEALLYKFAHSYTSSDSAGSSWERWSDEYKETPMIYVEHMGEEYPEDDCVHSRFYDEWILADHAVFLGHLDSYVLTSDTVESRHENRRILDDSAIHSDILQDYISMDDAIELENYRGWVPIDYANMTEYNGTYFHTEDMVKAIGHEEIIPKRECYYSRPLDAYILRSEAVNDGRDYYTADTLPKKEEEESPKKAKKSDDIDAF